LRRQLKRIDHRRVDQHLAARQPMTRIDDHPTDLPVPVVEQEILDVADAAVGGGDGASDQTACGKQHSALPSWSFRTGGPIDKLTLKSRRRRQFRPGFDLKETGSPPLTAPQFRNSLLGGLDRYPSEVNR